MEIREWLCRGPSCVWVSPEPDEWNKGYFRGTVLTVEESAVNLMVLPNRERRLPASPRREAEEAYRQGTGQATHCNSRLA